MDLRTQKNEAAIQKLDLVKKAMQRGEVVEYEGKPYKVNAIRLCNSVIYGGLIYQAEIVSADPTKWNCAYYVALESVLTSGESNRNNRRVFAEEI